MDLSQIPLLTTAIAICIAWALFALFCSYLHEAVAQLIAERGRFLKTSLFKQLLDSPNGVNWAQMVYQHGSIDLLTRDEKKPTSEISPELFAKTLIEVTGSAHLVQMNAPTLGNQRFYKSDLLNNFVIATKVLQPSDVTSMFKQCLADAEVRATVNDAVDEAKLYDLLVANTQNWYNQLMGRISLWYKKSTRKRLFILGALLAAILNVDSIQLFEQFSSNESARNAVISYYAKNKTDLENKAAIFKNDSTARKTDTTVKRQLAAINDSLKNLSKQANLPIGIANNLYSSVKADIGKPNPVINIISKIIGILISGFAASFGAPFWFDLLKKVYTPKSNS